MQDMLIRGIVLAVWVGSWLVVWELGHRQGHKHEREWSRLRLMQLMEQVRQLDPEAFEALEVASYMLAEDDRELAELEKIGRL